MRAALGLGANLGDREEALRVAVERIRGDEAVAAVIPSSIYETEPVGGPQQPDFLNMVVVVDLVDGPTPEVAAVHLLDLAQSIEQELARVRDVRWGPRTMDVDILAVADLVLGRPELTVPHPRVAERAFVLIPWAQVDPDFVIPGLGTVRRCASALPPGRLTELDR